jgi:hypothetical protein
LEVKHLKPLAAAALVGVLCGAGGLRLAEALTTEQDLGRQKAELARISEDLRAREAALAENQANLTAQAAKIAVAAGQARNLADQALSVQGTALDRLKGALAALRMIRDDLRAGTAGQSAEVPRP